MPKVVALRGQTPSGWAKDRWVWLRAVTADGSLLAMPRLLATVLATGYANHETAECNPGLKELMAAVAASRATVFRALADLAEAGWLVRMGGEGPGKKASYRFTYPERVSPMTPERVSQVTQETAERVSPMTPERVSPVNTTGLTAENPPIPPYKAEPNMNHKGLHRAASQVIVKGGQRPRSATVCVAAGSVAAERWDEWLAANGYPPLAKIGLRLDQGGRDGWEMPLTIPAGFGDEMASRIALRWADWLRSKA